MTPDRAKAAILESLERPSSTPCTWKEDRSQYIADMKSELAKHLVEPVETTAVACKWAQEHCNADDAVHRVYAVASRGETWLLFEPTEEVFMLAEGNVETPPLLMTHGLPLASNDALAEWLG